MVISHFRGRRLITAEHDGLLPLHSLQVSGPSGRADLRNNRIIAELMHPANSSNFWQDCLLRMEEKSRNDPTWCSVATPEVLKRAVLLVTFPKFSGKALNDLRPSQLLVLREREEREREREIEKKKMGEEVRDLLSFIEG